MLYNFDHTFGFDRLVKTLEQRFYEGRGELLSGILEEIEKFDRAKCFEDDVAILMVEAL